MSGPLTLPACTLYNRLRWPVTRREQRSDSPQSDVNKADDEEL